MFCMCTILVKHQVAMARALVRSFMRHHPGGKAFALLADESEGSFGMAEEPFEWVRLKDIGLPNDKALPFGLEQAEFARAVQPYLLEYLLRIRKAEALLYFDPDVWIVHRLDDVIRRLDDAAVLLVPRLTAPLPDDGKRPTERELATDAGVYDDGFIGVSARQAAFDLLQWRKRRPEPQALDAAPGLFEGVEVLRSDGCGVGYWNAPVRRIALRRGTFLAGDEPLLFYHFSGLVPDLSVAARGQTRIVWSDAPDLKRLYEQYVAELNDNGLPFAAGWRYTYDYFDNGVRVPQLARRMYREMGASADMFGDPFAAGRPGSFYTWLHSPVNGSVALPRLLHAMHRARPDLQAAFPDPLGADREALMEWSRLHAPLEFGLDAAIWHEVLEAYRPAPPAAAPARRSVSHAGRFVRKSRNRGAARRRPRDGRKFGAGRWGR